jgi:hypothetical protein
MNQANHNFRGSRTIYFIIEKFFLTSYLSDFALVNRTIQSLLGKVHAAPTDSLCPENFHCRSRLTLMLNSSP